MPTKTAKDNEPEQQSAAPTAVPVATDEADRKIQLLVQALNKVQAAMKAAPKDATNPHYKSKYATLASAWNACRKALGENGFAVVQQPVMGEGGAVVLHTIIYHEGGANIDCFYPVVYAPCAAPALGAALKYARRYSLETMVGITSEDDPEDDDGNKAPAPPPPQQRQQAAPVQRTPNPPAAAQVQGARPTLQDQATAYIAKVEGAKTWDEFMAVLSDAGNLVERIRVADKSGKWVTRINEIVREKRDTLEVPQTEPAAPPVEEAPQ